MKKAKYTATQILEILHEAEALLRSGKSVKEAVRHLKISESTYYQMMKSVDEIFRDREMTLIAERRLAEIRSGEATLLDEDEFWTRQA